MPLPVRDGMWLATASNAIAPITRPSGTRPNDDLSATRTVMPTAATSSAEREEGPALPGAVGSRRGTNPG